MKNGQDVYAYGLDGNLYLNVTNRCTNSCDFCVRQHDTYKSYPLWLEKEPEFEDFLPYFADLKKYKEIVFCGYGEPLYRYDLILKVGRYLKEQGCQTRINTNGHGDLINGVETAKGLAGAIDRINVSLNCPTAQKYCEVCHPEAGERAFAALIAFAHSCKNAGIAVNFSIVDSIPKEDVEACKTLAERESIPLTVRSYIDEE